MWHLKTDKTKAQQYAWDFWKMTKCEFTKAAPHLKTYVPKKLRHTRAYNYITESIFKDYLPADPDQLLILHNQLFTHILNVAGKTFDQQEWYEYLKDNTIHPEYSNITDDEIKAIKSIFNYDAYIAQNTDLSYHLAGIMDSNTCVYCNRQYTLTVITKAGEKIIRPEFDHWFAQSLYPDLALSYFNLIPACALCNSILKNNKETELSTHIHPYKDLNPGFKFSYRHLVNGKCMVVCRNYAATLYDKNRVANTLKLFRIQEVYNAHADLELQDLIDLASANPGDYIHDLIQHVLSSTTLTEEDVFRLIFGVEANVDKFINRPLSKFKTDIIEKIHDRFLKGGKP